ncbi:MAG TPA: hypothetical protein HA348_04235 [Thermoplasmata archaeon]|nr:hypothetical protein [Thermoplasmata archaeon]
MKKLLRVIRKVMRRGTKRDTVTESMTYQFGQTIFPRPIKAMSIIGATIMDTKQDILRAIRTL